MLILMFSFLLADLSSEVSLCVYSDGIIYDQSDGNAKCVTDCTSNDPAVCGDDVQNTRRIRFETSTGGAAEAKWNMNECAPNAYDSMLYPFPGLWSEQGMAERWQRHLNRFCVVHIGSWAGGWWQHNLDTNDGGIINAGRRIAAIQEHLDEIVNVDHKPIATVGPSGGCLAATMCPLVYSQECEIASNITFLGCVSGGTHWDAEHQCNADDCIGSTCSGWHTIRKTEFDGSVSGGANCASGNAANLPLDSLEQQWSADPFTGHAWFWVGTSNTSNDDDTNGVKWGLTNMYNATSKFTGQRTWTEDPNCGHGDAAEVDSDPACAAGLLQALKDWQDGIVNPPVCPPGCAPVP